MNRSWTLYRECLRTAKMKDVSEITALVFDHGLFLPLARRLARTYKRVLYHTPWEKGFPTVNDCAPGYGYPDIERVDDIWAHKDEADLWVFPDIQHAGLQLELESQGKAVWGARDGDSLELNRTKFHRVLADAGLDAPTVVEVMGLTNLRVHLKDKTDKYIKISKYRGTMETHHWRDWEHDEGWLDQMAVKLGGLKERIRFLVVDNIDTDIETGGDTYGVDGEWPDYMLQGYEWKDKGYFSAVTKREDMPEQIGRVLEAFGPELAKYRYRQQWSMEVRVKDDKAYFIDPTCRGGLPSTGSQMEVWANWPEIIWHGAHGEMIQPEPAAKYTVESILSLKGDRHSWGCIKVPEKLDRWVKLAGGCRVDGMDCFPPDEGHGDEVGWLVSMDDTMSATIKLQLERAKELPDGLSAATDSLVDILKEIHNAESDGIEFSPQTVPEPEIVIAD